MLFLIIPLLAGMLAACGDTTTIAQAEPAAATTIAPVNVGDRIMVDGRVVPQRTADLAFAATGVISEVVVAEGEQVTAGAVLARLNAEQQQAAVDQAVANVVRAKAALDQLRTQPYPEDVMAAEAALAQAVADQEMLEQIGGSDNEYAAAEAIVKHAQAQLDALNTRPRSSEVTAAKAELTAAEAALAQARAARDSMELRAPFAGTIAFLDLEEGEVPSPGVPSIRLADTGTWLVETADLTELNVVHLHEDDGATVRFDALPDMELRGTIERIRQYGEPHQGDIVYRAVIALEPHAEALRWNMTATVTIEPNQ
jgi:multidrug efflux pump subunit AcrA (membrane-fusion protein)